MLLVLSTLLFGSDCTVPRGGTSLPVQYLADRFALRIPSTAGPLRFYLDTGGGANMLFATGVKRLGLTPTPADGPPGTGTIPAAKVPLPEGVPVFPTADPGGEPELFVPPSNPEMETEADGPLDGFLGQAWFADRVWMFDYPAHALVGYRDSVSLGGTACWVGLGFQVDSVGRRTVNFPRVPAVVDGDTLQFLLDTGAMTRLADSALVAIADGGPARRGTSFITESVFRRWQEKHRDWRVIERAEQGTHAAMIEVPRVTVGGAEVGPVWFTMRPDRAFHSYMAQWTDRPLDGALGGSAFRTLAVVIDYPRSRAAFLRRHN
ncbi:MAG TPA: hypothetical protein VG692_18350 [Gemmatimonadales bacterium]|nr:hypothetical protein [Gemmatimonadales bacterium]